MLDVEELGPGSGPHYLRLTKGDKRLVVSNSPPCPVMTPPSRSCWGRGAETEPAGGVDARPRCGILAPSVPRQRAAPVLGLLLRTRAATDLFDSEGRLDSALEICGGIEVYEFGTLEQRVGERRDLRTSQRPRPVVVLAPDSEDPIILAMSACAARCSR
ncbi:hypothetical protein WME95_45690 [Sorangium sp. So ce327]|uniref:hypothetical protein n=1 Tax=Sorangium sp. So ce327 TaxID=3133301 RepID=UPI003F62C8C6